MIAHRFINYAQSDRREKRGYPWSSSPTHAVCPPSDQILAYVDGNILQQLRPAPLAKAILNGPKQCPVRIQDCSVVMICRSESSHIDTLCPSSFRTLPLFISCLTQLLCSTFLSWLFKLWAVLSEGGCGCRLLWLSETVQNPPAQLWN